MYQDLPYVGADLQQSNNKINEGTADRYREMVKKVITGFSNVTVGICLQAMLFFKNLEILAW